MRNYQIITGTCIGFMSEVDNLEVQTGQAIDSGDLLKGSKGYQLITECCNNVTKLAVKYDELKNK
jgi:hypothetical protein